MRKWLLSTLLLSFMTGGAWAGLVAKIDVSRQTMTVIENGAAVYSWKVSTAGKGYRTPRGSYRPTRLHRMWYSRKYDNAPMPHSIFFRGGYAIHGTDKVKSLGRPASHGCVRLHPANARALFRLVKAHGAGNTRIIVQD
jgi:lipoprotein-anchoring transpeptidase ErfK/SrfK